MKLVKLVQSESVNLSLSLEELLYIKNLMQKDMDMGNHLTDAQREFNRQWFNTFYLMRDGEFKDLSDERKKVDTQKINSVDMDAYNQFHQKHNGNCAQLPHWLYNAHKANIGDQCWTDDIVIAENKLCARRIGYVCYYTWNQAKHIGSMASVFGWRLPTVDDVENMCSHLVGGEKSGGQLLKSDTAWGKPDRCGVNYEGFNMKPTGLIESPDISFYSEQNYGAFWTQTEEDGEAFAVIVGVDNTIHVSKYNPKWMMPVRLVIDVAEAEHGS